MVSGYVSLQLIQCTRNLTFFIGLLGLHFLREKFKRSMTSPPQKFFFGIDGFYAALLLRLIL